VKRVAIISVLAFIAAVALSAERGWLERSRLIVEREACIGEAAWTSVGNVLIAHGCRRTALLYDLASARVSAIEFSYKRSEHGLASIAFGPNGELGLLAYGGEAVIVDKNLAEIGRFRRRVSGQAIAWNRDAWEVADFYGIVRYNPSTGSSERVVEAWKGGGPIVVRRLGVRLHEGQWKWVYLSYRQDSWASFVFGRRIEVEFFEVSETGARRDLARVVTGAELHPYSFDTQPDGIEFYRELANNNLMAFSLRRCYEIDGEAVKLHTQDISPLEVFARDRFELDATTPWQCRVSAIYVSPEDWRRGFNCGNEIRSPRGKVAFDRGRLVAENGKEVETGFEQVKGFTLGFRQYFADPSGDIVVVGPTMRRIKVYSPQLDLVREVRFEVSAEAARALWGSNRWEK
jgi:hypothetical protein